jgi:tetratricopeptide (TPR) repeat protein
MGEVVGVFGREEEWGRLLSALDAAVSGVGSSVLITGDAGIGKTALTEMLLAAAGDRGCKVMSGAASSESLRPLLVFSRALGAQLLSEGSTVSFASVFAMDAKGALVASAERGGQSAAVAMAGMLSAIQDFVRDSVKSQRGGGLGRLEYGGSTILVEHGDGLSLAGIVEGREHPEMAVRLRRALGDAETGGVDDTLKALLAEKFSSRRALEGANLEAERIRVAEDVLARLRTSAPALLLLEDVHWVDESSLFVLNYVARNVRRERAMVVATLRPRESARAAGLAAELVNKGEASELALGPLGEDAVKSMLDGACSPNAFPPEFAAELASRCGGNPFFVKEMVRQMLDAGNITVKGGKHVIANAEYDIPDSLEGVVQARLSMLEPDVMALAEYASCIGRSFDADAVQSTAFVPDPAAALRALVASGIVDGKDKGFEFCHAVFQDSIYRGMNPSWKSRHHKSLGENLERKHAANLDAVVYELARHFSKTSDSRKAYDYCSMAGARASADFAPSAAVEFYEWALARVGQLGRSAVSEADELSLMERLGESASLSGHLSKAHDTFKKGAEISKDARWKARMLRKLADALTVQGKLDAALDALAEAERLVDDDEGSKESGCVSIARSYVQLMKGDYASSARMSEVGIERLAIFNDFESQRLAAKAWKIVGACHMLTGEHEAALSSYGRALEIGERINDPYGVSASYNNIGNVHLSRGEFDKAAGYYERALEIDEKTGDLQAVSYALNNMGIVHKNRGRYEDALECYQRCLDAAEKVGEPQGQASANNNIGNAMAELGRTEESLESYRKSLAISEKVGDKQLTASNLCAIAGSLIDLGRLDKAEEANSRAAAISSEIGTRGNALWAKRNAGVIASKRGDWTAAENAFLESATGFRELKMESEAMKTDFDRAESFLAKGDAAAAITLLDKAEPFFKSSGMASYVVKCGRLREAISRK